MDIKVFLSVLLLISIISGVSAVTVTDSITTDGAYWTVPEGVTLVDITLIGAGGTGTGGFYGYQNSFPTYFYIRFPGIGGLPGTKTTYTNVRVTPGDSFRVTVGMPGEAYPPIKFPYSGTGTYSAPPEAYASTFSGGPSSVTINGVTYSSPGGHNGNYTISYDVNTTPVFTNSNNGVTGSNGYLIDSQIAQSGTSGSYGTGYPGGVGYGAGGGGGAIGGDITSTNGGGGSGGVGAQGVVQFTYDSTAATPWYPSGYVKNASGTAIPSATVIITQLLNSVTLTTDVNGYYSTITGNLLSNVPVNITTSKSGYDSDINTFTPISTDSVINTTLLESSRTCTPQCIEGITRNTWDHGSIPTASVYLIENITQTGYQTNISTESGYYKFSITASGTYDVWSSKDTYSNSSVSQVVV